MPNRIAYADAAGAGSDRCQIQTSQSIGMRASRVFSDIHDGQAMGGGEFDGVLGCSKHHLLRPAFCILPDRARPYEGAGLDRDADLLGDVDNRLDVLFESS